MCKEGDLSMAAVCWLAGRPGRVFCSVWESARPVASGFCSRERGELVGGGYSSDAGGHATMQSAKCATHQG